MLRMDNAYPHAALYENQPTYLDLYSVPHVCDEVYISKPSYLPSMGLV